MTHDLDAEIDRILFSEHSDPFHILGAHPIVEVAEEERETRIRGVVIRAFLPEASQAWIVADDTPNLPVPMERIRPEGFFAVSFPERGRLFSYQLRVQDHHGQLQQFVDPYVFAPLLTDFDLHLMGEGNHYKKYEKLGAHLREVNGVRGVQFAVWAPNAKRVSVIGDFNRWDGRRHPMRVRGSSGLWELFIPGLQEGTVYKFEIKSRLHGYLGEKSDPYGFYFEQPPKTASIVHDLRDYQWQDS